MNPPQSNCNELNKKLEEFLNSIANIQEESISLEPISDNLTRDLRSNISNHVEPTDNIVKYQEAIGKLEEIYKGTNYRHSYSTITKYIISHREKCIFDKDQKILHIIAFNIENIFATIDKQDIYEDEFKNKVFKLKDHINLEILRIRDIFDAENKTKAELEETKLELNNLKKESKQLNDNIEKSENQLKNMQKEYITILGIFAAIVFSFVAGLTFSTSVLSNIDKSSIYRLVLIVCLIGLFITNILHYLYSFVREIHFGISNKDKNVCVNIWENTKDKFCNSYIFKFNIFVACIILSTFLCWYIFENSKNDLESNTKKIKSNNKLELYATEPLNILKSELK